MIRLMLAQHIVDEIGRKSDLPSRLLLPRIAPLDQARNDGAIPESALQQARLSKPCVEIVTQHVLSEEFAKGQFLALMHEARIAQAPDGERIFRGDEAERSCACAIKTARQQHAERLMCQPPLE